MFLNHPVSDAEVNHVLELAGLTRSHLRHRADEPVPY